MAAPPIARPMVPRPAVQAARQVGPMIARPGPVARPGGPAPAARPAAPAMPRFTSADDAILEQALGMKVPAMQPQEPDRYDSVVVSGGKKVLTPQEQAAQAKQAQAERVAAKRVRTNESVQYLSLLAQSNGIVTEVTPPVNGDGIESYYTKLFTNDTNGAVRLQVFADFVNPGVGVVLSLTADASDVGKVDELSLTANGKVESISVIVLPTFSLFVRDRDAAFFPMQANDVIRVRVFDPAKLLSYSNLYPEKF
jgi:hypothetical protein